MSDESRFFVNIYLESDCDDCDCFSCDASCHCECDGGGDCDWG